MQFNPAKTTQAAAVVLKKHAGRISRLRLLKILYITEREILTETLRPLLGDRVVAMDHGPVQSETYNLLRMDSRFIVKDGPRDHVLKEDPGTAKLSPYEVRKLEEVSDRFWTFDDYDIAIATHQFQEWIDNQPVQGSSKPIPVEDILTAIGHADQIDRVMKDREAELEIDRLLGTVGE